MSIAETETKLPLDEWARLMGVNPLHFAGVALPDIRFLCETAWHQFDWQDHDRVGREEVARAIAQAEADIESYLGYRLLPSWERDEWHNPKRPWRQEFFNLSGSDLRGLGQPIEPTWHQFVSGGIRQAVLQEATAAIVYTSDRPPTDYDNLATVTTTLSQFCPPCEIQVFYPGHNGEERFRIKPVEVAVNGTTFVATITFQRHQVIIEDIINAQVSHSPDDSQLRPANGLDDTDFLTTVDVYRVYNDPQQQATLLFEPFSKGSCGCAGTGCPGCAYKSQTACLLLRTDPRLGMVVIHPANWNQTNLDFDLQPFVDGRGPDIVRLWYYAGLRDQNRACEINDLDPDWARTIAIYASSMLDRRPCQCSTHFWERWARDRAFTDGAGEVSAFDVSPSDLDNPFGTREGAIYAWRRVNRHKAAIGRSAHA